MSSTKGSHRQTHAVHRWSLDAALAGLPLGLIAVGPAITAGIGGRTLPVYASQIAIAVLFIHVGFSGLAHRGFGAVPATSRWLLATVVLLAVPLVWTNDPAGVLAYLNFASGTVGGLAIAQVWKCISRGYSWVDLGYLGFLVGGTAQLIVSLRSADALNSLHQSSQTPWGNSNFVAGCLVIAAFVVMARSVSLGRHRKYAITIGLAAIGVALLTLSRGAIVAACVGAVFFLWSKVGRRAPGRLWSPAAASKRVDHSIILSLVLRVLSVLIPVVAFIALERATELRAQLNDRVFVNVDLRVALYQLAWRDFLNSPLTGTGWASFRQSSLDAVGESQTFAHNIVFSMLQIGGLLSVPYLVVLAVLMYRAMRHGEPYRAAIAASVAVSMTQPFFESTIGTLIIVPAAVLAGLSTATAAEDNVHEIVAPGAGSTKKRVGLTRDRLLPSRIPTVSQGDPLRASSTLSRCAAPGSRRLRGYSKPAPPRA